MLNEVIQKFNKKHFWGGIETDVRMYPISFQRTEFFWRRLRNIEKVFGSKILENIEIGQYFEPMEISVRIRDPSLKSNRSPNALNSFSKWNIRNFNLQVAYLPLPLHILGWLKTDLIRLSHIRASPGAEQKL